jgi:hypothetical protein
MSSLVAAISVPFDCRENFLFVMWLSVTIGLGRKFEWLGSKNTMSDAGHSGSEYVRRQIYE